MQTGIIPKSQAQSHWIARVKAWVARLPDRPTWTLRELAVALRGKPRRSCVWCDRRTNSRGEWLPNGGSMVCVQCSTARKELQWLRIALLAVRLSLHHNHGLLLSLIEESKTSATSKR